MIKHLHNLLKQLPLSSTPFNGIGLVGGKMGLCVNLFAFSRVVNDTGINEKANAMLDEIFFESKGNLSLGFTDGLLGIGWGIEFLVRERFVEADSNEILYDLDQRVFLRKFYPTSNNEADYFGFMGLGNYMLSRLKSPSASDDHLSILMIKQNIIGIIEQLDWGKGIVIFGEKNGLPGTLKVLPMMLSFLTEMYELDIYNSRILKILDWVSENIEYNSNAGVGDKIELVTALTKIRPLLRRNNKVDQFIETLQDEISTAVKNTKSVFENPKEYVRIIWSYLEQSKHKSDNQTINKDALFWIGQFSHSYAQLQVGNKQISDKYLLNEIGFLNGFEGLYKILPLISESHNPSDIILSDSHHF